MGDINCMSDNDSCILERYERTIFKIKSSIQRFFVNSPLSMREFFVLKLIREYEENGNMITSSEISRLFCISRSAVSQFIASLEKRGYIVRKTDKNDKRKTYLSATADAKDILDDYKKGFSEILCGMREKMGSKRFNMLLELASDASELLEKQAYYGLNFNNQTEI